MSDERNGNGSDPAREQAALEQALAEVAQREACEDACLERLRLEVEREIAAERGFVAFLRSRSTPVRAAIAVATLTVMALLTLMRPRIDLSVYPMSRMVLALASMAIVFVLAVAVVLWPLQRASPPRWLTAAVPFFGLCSLAALYSLPAAHLAHSASFVHGTGFVAQLKRSTPCVIAGLFFAAQVYALLAVLDRGGRVRDYSFALAIGVAANMLLQLSCPVTTPEHLLIGHLGVLMILIFGIVRLRRGPA